MQETQETQVQSLGQEDPLEEEMATYSNILAWKIPWTEEPVSYSPQDQRQSDTTEWAHTSPVSMQEAARSFHTIWIKKPIIILVLLSSVF